jgi:Flp pilus assembly secretin CpaC
MTSVFKESQVMFQTIARRLGRAVLVSLALVVISGTAQADTEVTLEVNAGKTVTLARPATTIFVANPEIADVQAPANGASFFVFGKAAGRTSVFALVDCQASIAGPSAVLAVGATGSGAVGGDDARQTLQGHVGA